MEFPRLVYKSASVHVAVTNEDEHAEKLADGWFDTVPEALAGKAAVKVEAPKTEAKHKATPKTEAKE